MYLPNVTQTTGSTAKMRVKFPDTEIKILSSYLNILGEQKLKSKTKLP